MRLSIRIQPAVCLKEWLTQEHIILYGLPSFTLAALGLHFLKKASPLQPCLILFSRELGLKFP